MKEIQKIIEAMLALVFGIVFLQALPRELFFVGLLPFLLIFVAIAILVIKWIDENFF